MFGDIIKVTPSSKLLEIWLTYDYQRFYSEDVLDPNKEISFPSSVVEFFKGEIGIPLGGFPENEKFLHENLLKEQVSFGKHQFR